MLFFFRNEFNHPRPYYPPPIISFYVFSEIEYICLVLAKVYIQLNKNTMTIWNSPVEEQTTETLRNPGTLQIFVYSIKELDVEMVITDHFAPALRIQLNELP